MNIAVHTKEHDELMRSFEKFAKQHFYGIRVGREAKESWANGNIYSHGETNQFFRMFRMGYTLAKAMQDGAPDSAEQTNFDDGFAAGFAKAIEVLQGYQNVRVMK